MQTQTNAEFQLNVIRETLNIADYEGFVDHLNLAIADLTMKAPQDGFITVDVLRRGGGYRIMIRLASSDLNFLEEGEGRSPFFALERVLLKASAALRVWSINRKF